jgi:hypothetical protein
MGRGSGRTTAPEGARAGNDSAPGSLQGTSQAAPGRNLAGKTVLEEDLLTEVEEEQVLVNKRSESGKS